MVLVSLEKAVDLLIFESKLASLLSNCLVSEKFDLLNTLLADFDVEIVLCLLTIILMVRPGMAGVEALELIRWAILSAPVTVERG
jgi:hypothetical protein